MAWLWTDDLARILVEAGAVRPERVSRWLARPVAFATDREPESFAAELLAAEDEEGERRAA